MEKAARIIERTVLGRQTTAPSTALAITQALADAGLLAPDLPEPDNERKEMDMSKTLADMTPQQRQQCVGMWATNHNYTGDGESVGVIACVQHSLVWLIHTHLHGEWSMFSVDSVSPRHDLPRAWHPDGTPPKGDEK